MSVRDAGSCRRRVASGLAHWELPRFWFLSGRDQAGLSLSGGDGESGPHTSPFD